MAHVVHMLVYDEMHHLIRAGPLRVSLRLNAEKAACRPALLISPHLAP